MEIDEPTGSWQWVGDGSTKRVAYDTREFERTYYNSVYRTLEPGNGCTRPNLHVKVGDVVLMNAENDPEPWVAQCVDLCQFGPEEVMHVEQEAGSPSRDQATHAACMRVTLRWFYRPSDVKRSVPNLETHPWELFLTDNVTPAQVNRVDVISDVAVLKNVQSDVPARRARNVYFCCRFYWTSDAEVQVPVDIPPKEPVADASRFRYLKQGELDSILRRPSNRRNLFWYSLLTRPGARKSSARIPMGTTPGSSPNASGPVEVAAMSSPRQCITDEPEKTACGSPQEPKTPESSGSEEVVIVRTKTAPAKRIAKKDPHTTSPLARKQSLTAKDLEEMPNEAVPQVLNRGHGTREHMVGIDKLLPGNRVVALNRMLEQLPPEALEILLEKLPDLVDKMQAHVAVKSNTADDAAFAEELVKALWTPDE